jgi:alpha-tubulin suppressor-like RCC1 family protein
MASTAETAVAISTGFDHTCIVTGGNTVKCWGSNNTGQLGIGNSNIESSSTPLEVGSLQGVKSVASGRSHTCALTHQGDVYCWGYNNLGSGQFNQSYSPVPMPDLQNIKSISAGADFTCVIASDDSVSCWGILGNINGGASSFGVTKIYSDFNNQVVMKAKSIAAGFTPMICLITLDDKVKCSSELTSAYQEISNLSNVKQVSMGYQTYCALKNDGTIWCWGDNSEGQLGIGSLSPSSTTTPIHVANASGAMSLSSGISSDTTCFVNSDGALACWGRNNSVPHSIPGNYLAAQVATGWGFTCFIEKNGKVKCLGRNDEGQLGNGQTTDSIVPVNVNFGP